jgi:hypothetical protein
MKITKKKMLNWAAIMILVMLLGWLLFLKTLE